MATITSTATGLYSVGGTWVGGIAPVLGDKVVIAHTSTGLEQFSTDATGYAIGATAITLTGSVAAGSYVIGESVLFGNDPNYYTITNWVSGTKVLTVSPLIIAIPASATVVKTRGHVVTVAGTLAGGDDTSTGITVNGTLKASRAATSQFTARGELFIGTNGSLDYGTELDPIPVAYTADIIINDSAAMANNKWGISTSSTNNWYGFRLWGASKTVDTVTTTSVGTSDTVINVADTTGWAIGNWISFGPAIGSGTITARVITAVTATTVTIGASLGAARISGTKVMNLSSNVRIWGSSGNTYRSQISLIVTSGHQISNCVEMGPCEIRLCGGGGSTWQFGGFVINYNSVSTATNVVKKINGPMVHGWWNVTGSTATQLPLGGNYCSYSFFGNQGARITVEKLYHSSAGIGGLIMYSGASIDITTYKSMCGAAMIQSGYSQGAVDCNINGGYSIGNTRIVNTSGIKITVSNMELDGFTRLFDGNQTAFGAFNINNCTIGQNLGFVNTTEYVTSIGALAPLTITDCQIPDSFSTDLSTSASKTQNSSNYLYIVNRNLDPQRQEKYTSGGVRYRQNVTNYRSKYCMQFDCWNTATGITETTAVPIDASATIKIIGYVRFNATFGTATPPTVTVSGLGITPQVYTCTATADTWFKYEFDVTNPQIYGGNLTVTFYAITASAGSGASCWFDGLIVSPYCTDSRHYGYLFDINAYRTVNSVITETDEATVGAYTGIAIDHTTNTLTISSTHSVAEIYDYVYYDLVQTANLSEPEWFTSTDGINFSCTYDIVNTSVIIGTGTITTTQQYTGGGTSSVIIVDSTGTFNNMTITGLVANSRVRVNNATDNIELYNSVVAGTSVTIPSFWTTNKTLDLRVTNVIGLTAYLPYQAGGTLTATGASFLVSQELDTVYNTIAIDGSTVTEFSADYPNVQVDIDDGDGSTSVQRLYAWFEYAMHSSQGIITYFNGITAQDTLNYQVNTNVVDLEFDNISATSIPIKITGAYIYRDDGTSVIYSGSKSIQMDPARAYSVGVMGLSTEEHNHLMKINRGGGGGAIIDYKLLEEMARKIKNDILDSIEKLPKTINTPILDKIELVKESINDNIVEGKLENGKFMETITAISELSEYKSKDIKGLEGIVEKAKENNEKFLHNLEIKEQEKEIQQELSGIEKEIEEQIASEIKVLDEELEKQIQNEINILESNL